MCGFDKKRADITAKMQQLIDAGIEIHAQVVLCPTINDGEVLRKTIHDLADMHPHVSSVAIVPLGLTRYLDDPRLTPVTSEFCRETIDQVSKIQKELRARLGTTFAFLGDEIYLKASRAIPSRKHYGDYPQIEDGIGMVRNFVIEFEQFKRRLVGNSRSAFQRQARKLNGTIMTGTLFAPVFGKMISELNERFGARVKVLAVPNEYFGGDVSVAGLLTGGDFAAVRNLVNGDFAILPRVSLKSDEPIFLDGMRFDELQKQFRVPLYAFDLAGLTNYLSAELPNAHARAAA